MHSAPDHVGWDSSVRVYCTLRSTVYISTLLCCRVSCWPQATSPFLWSQVNWSSWLTVRAVKLKMISLLTGKHAWHTNHTTHDHNKTQERALLWKYLVSKSRLSLRFPHMESNAQHHIKHEEWSAPHVSAVTPWRSEVTHIVLPQRQWSCFRRNKSFTLSTSLLSSHSHPQRVHLIIHDGMDVDLFIYSLIVECSYSRECVRVEWKGQRHRFKTHTYTHTHIHLANTKMFMDQKWCT